MVEHLFKIDGTPSRVRHLKRLFADFDTIRHAQSSYKEEYSRDGRFSAARDAIRTELRGQIDVERLRRQTWTRQTRYVSHAIASGTIDQRVAILFFDSYAWEEVARSILVEDILQSYLRRVEDSIDKKSLNAQAVGARQAHSGFGAILESMIICREGLVLSVEAWNSDEIEAIYRSKPWNRLPELTGTSDPASELLSAVNGVRRLLGQFEQLGERKPSSRLSGIPHVEQFGRDVFQSLFRDSASA